MKEEIKMETIRQKLEEVEHRLLCAENNLRNIQTNIDGAERMVPTFNPNLCVEDVLESILMLAGIVLSRTVDTQMKVG
jgi:hypothetical protein